MKQFLFSAGTRETISSIGMLFLRVSTGLMMLIGHGLGKLQGFAEKKDAFPVPSFFPLNLMSPPISLIATIGAEVGCAALLILGIATRPAAFILAFTMIVAAFHIHASGPFFYGPGAVGPKEPAILYIIPAITILLAGAGKYSFDSLIAKKERRRSW